MQVLLGIDWSILFTRPHSNGCGSPTSTMRNSLTSDFYCKVVLAGGTIMFDGIVTRMTKELTVLQSTMRSRSWLLLTTSILGMGGSILFTCPQPANKCIDCSVTSTTDVVVAPRRLVRHPLCLPTFGRCGTPKSTMSHRRRCTLS